MPRNYCCLIRRCRVRFSGSNQSDGEELSERLMDSFLVALMNIFQRNDKLVDMLCFAINEEIEHTGNPLAIFVVLLLIQRLPFQTSLPGSATLPPSPFSNTLLRSYRNSDVSRNDAGRENMEPILPSCSGGGLTAFVGSYKGNQSSSHDPTFVPQRSVSCSSFFPLELLCTLRQ